MMTEGFEAAGYADILNIEQGGKHMMKRFFAWLLALLMLGGLAPAALAADPDAAAYATRPEYDRFSDFSGRTVSMLTGAPFEELVREKAPDVGAFTSFNNMPDMLLALKSGKTDAVLINNAIAALAVNRDPGLALFPQNLQDGAFGFAFARGDSRRDAWQEALDAIPEAQIRAAWDKWTGADESAKVLPEQDWPGGNGTVRVAACDTLEPMSYAGAGGTPVGFDLEVIQMIARALDVHVEFTGMEFSAILSSVQAGKADIGAGSIIITPERAESVDFVEYYPAAFVLIVRAANAENGTHSGITSLADLEHGRIAVMTGSINGPLAEARFPEADVHYYNSQTDMLTAIRTGKADALIAEKATMRVLKLDNPELTILDETLSVSNLAAVFAKTEAGQALCEQYSAFVDKLWADGTMAEIDSVWFGADEAKRTLPDYENLPAVNGTLRMAVDPTLIPFVYMKDNRAVGYDIDIASRFCREYGYGLKIVSMSFDGILASVQSGKCDFSDSCITITEERAESVLFSSPNYYSGIVACVWKGAEPAAGVTEDRSATGGIWASFEKTFIREERWKLFLDGVLTTLMITLLAILFGTALGFLVFMTCRNGNAFANAVTRFCLWLVQGMPMVVLLMILYYIVFSSVPIGGIAVAVIGFTLTFGASVFGLLKMGVGAVDKGQYEAAGALGYSGRRTFFEVILPQALPHVMPSYKGEIVGLIKATAIVGYIAVQDLTKMGDIVRSRTYEAFFPLIAVTVIYFALEALIGFVVRRINADIDPKRRSPERILKGTDPRAAAGGGSPAGGKAGGKEAGAAAARKPVIQIEHLQKAYPDVTPLKDVNTVISDGDVISVIGPSGTGKSTLLRCINLLEKPTAGRIRVEGAEITDPKCDINRVRQKMGMVFQSFNLFGHKTVIENIMMAPMRLLGKSKQEAYETGMRLLRTVGLAEKALNYPDQLSGGQKQRIAIARTLAMDPDVILLDEPTSALDPTMVGEVQAVIRDLAKTGKTMMIVTHEMAFARAISNRVFYMDEGGIYEDGTPDQIFDNPQREKTRRFVRRLKVLELNIESRDYDFLGVSEEIIRYCGRNQIPAKQANRIRVTFEELVQQMLMPVLEKPRIQAVIEYAEADGQARMTVRWNGPQENVLERGDGLSRTIFTGLTSQQSYSAIAADGFTNWLEFVFAEKE